MRGPSSSSVVTCVISARFFTNPQASPSGVSQGHNIPHCRWSGSAKSNTILHDQNKGPWDCYQLTWLGCRALGPLTFLDFSNCGEIFVMCPTVPMYESLAKTCKTSKRNKEINIYYNDLRRRGIDMQCHKHLCHAFPVHLKSSEIPISSRKSSF